MRSPKMSPSGQVLGVLSQAIALDSLMVSLSPDIVNYFLTVPLTVLIGAATLVMPLYALPAQGYFLLSIFNTINKIGNQNFFNIQRSIIS